VYHLLAIKQNLHCQGVIANVLHLPTLGQITVQSTLSFADHNEAFLKLPVQRFLWGYDDRIMDLARPFLSIGAQFRYDKFGLLVSHFRYCGLDLGELSEDAFSSIPEAYRRCTEVGLKAALLIVGSPVHHHQARFAKLYLAHPNYGIVYDIFGSKQLDNL
ncbi:scavenger receptor protein, partial [Danaus plexippus plexippus]